VGILVHRLLEQWDFEKGIEQLTILIEANDLEEDHSLREEVRGIFETFLRLPLYSDLRRADILGREVPFMAPWSVASPQSEVLPSAVPGTLSPSKGRPQPSVLEGVVDLLYRLDGRLWIADYKTDQVNESELQARVDLYRPQADAYKTGVLQSLGVSSVNFQFVFLRTGQVVNI
jgi:ATP-dependent helicase/nuclease subunit A